MTPPTPPDPASPGHPGQMEAAVCPYCGETDTTREHPKGPSLCRAIHYCHTCEESFETLR